MLFKNNIYIYVSSYFNIYTKDFKYIFICYTNYHKMKGSDNPNPNLKSDKNKKYMNLYKFINNIINLSKIIIYVFYY